MVLPTATTDTSNGIAFILSEQGTATSAMPLEVSVVAVGKTIQRQGTVEAEYFSRFRVDAARKEDSRELSERINRKEGNREVFAAIPRSRYASPARLAESGRINGGYNRQSCGERTGSADAAGQCGE